MASPTYKKALTFNLAKDLNGIAAWECSMEGIGDAIISKVELIGVQVYGIPPQQGTTIPQVPVLFLSVDTSNRTSVIEGVLVGASTSGNSWNTIPGGLEPCEGFPLLIEQAPFYSRTFEPMVNIADWTPESRGGMMRGGGRFRIGVRGGTGLAAATTTQNPQFTELRVVLALTCVRANDTIGRLERRALVN